MAWLERVRAARIMPSSGPCATSGAENASAHSTTRLITVRRTSIIYLALSGVLAVNVTANCQNCDAPLKGQFCHECGQKVPRSNPTVGDFLHDATAELTHWDG